MVKLINEAFMENGVFIVFSKKIMKIQDIDSMEGKRFTDWNQLVRYVLQRLRVRELVQIVDCKTFECVWLKPDKIDEYTQSGGILNTDR